MGETYSVVSKKRFFHRRLCRERSWFVVIYAMLAAAVIGIDPFLYALPRPVRCGERDEESGDRRL